MRSCLVFVAFLLSACGPNPGRKTYNYAGVVMGRDTGTCACCGGYIIVIENQPTQYRFFSFPADAPMDTAKFPAQVLLNYKELKVCDSIHHIAIEDIQPRYRTY